MEGAETSRETALLPHPHTASPVVSTRQSGTRNSADQGTSLSLKVHSFHSGPRSVTYVLWVWANAYHAHSTLQGTSLCSPSSLLLPSHQKTTDLSLAPWFYLFQNVLQLESHSRWLEGGFLPLVICVRRGFGFTVLKRWFPALDTSPKPMGPLW